MPSESSKITEQSMHPPVDILVVQANPFHGYDFNVGDVHGNFKILQHMISNLRKDESGQYIDRMFFDGDLADRGEESLQVIHELDRLMREYPENFFVAFGNHEELNLDIINTLSEIHLRSSQLSEDDLDSAYTALNKVVLRNGCEWLTRLYQSEIESNKIYIEGNEVKYTADSEILFLKSFLSQLPTIIYVEDERAFNTVHADMPFGDKVLKMRIDAGNLWLTEVEKKHAIWARENDPVYPAGNKGRTKMSSIAYTGHTVVAVRDNNITSVRADSNTIDGDFGAEETDQYVLINHHLGTCQLLGEPRRILATDSQGNYLLNENGENRFESEIEFQARQERMTRQAAAIQVHLQQKIKLFNNKKAKTSKSSASNPARMFAGTADSSDSVEPVVNPENKGPRI